MQTALNRAVFLWEVINVVDTRTPDFPSFLDSTGYGKADGLLGVNCQEFRHSFSPFYPGISTPRWTPETLKEYAEKTYKFKGADGEEKEVDAYKASQIQRNYERNIRHIKRKIETQKAAGLEVLKKDKDALKEANRRLNQFLGDTGLRKQQFRLMVQESITALFYIYQLINWILLPDI